MPTIQDAIPPACRRIQALAERDPRRAVPLARRALETLQTDDPLVDAWVRYTLGWALLCWERFDAARPYLQDALARFDPCDALIAALYCRRALLVADLMQLARPDLEQELAALAKEFEQAGAPIEAARTRLHQAVLMNMLGRPLDAEVLLTEITPAITQSGLVDQARLLRVQGAAAYTRGDFARASDRLIQAERRFVTLRQRLDVAKCWFEQAWCALRQEQLDTALISYLRAERVFMQLDLPLRIAWCIRDIGLAYTRRGTYDLALRATLNAMARFTGLKRLSDVGACHLHLGNIYLYTSRWEAALGCYTRAESIYTTLGLVGYSLIAQRNSAMVYHAQGQYAEATRLLCVVGGLAQELGNLAELAEVWSVQATLLADESQLDEAMLRYQQAHDLFIQIGNLPAAAECVLKQGWLALSRGVFEDARSLFHTAAPMLAQHPHHQWRVAYGLAHCAEAQGDIVEALDRYRAASATIAYLRRRLASEEVSSGLYGQAAQLHADALHLTTRQGAIEAMLEISEGQRALVLQRLLSDRTAPLPDEYRAEHDALRVEIARLLDAEDTADSANAFKLDAALAAYGDLLLRARHSAPVRPAPYDEGESAFNLTALRERLVAAYGAGWTALTYILNGDRLLIGVITLEDAALEQTPYDERLQRLIAQASQPLHRRYTYLDLPYLQGHADQPWARLRSLADRLLPKSVRARLHPRHRLLIVPSGPLHALPWAALRLEDGWLAERAVVQIAPSLTTWQMLAARQPADGKGALLIGCSEYGERALSLPAVDAELAAVAARWPGPCDRLLDEQATRVAVLERSAHGELVKYSLLHFAGHAWLLPARGLAAHLKLWDGDLLLPEVASLQLAGALVTLSACDGAAADALPGEEVLSLSWAFLAAGASGVLASLWPVDDIVIVAMMTTFYDAIRDCGDAALALAEAQRKLIATADAIGSPAVAPLDWVSFVLVGRGCLHW
jgi:tetratricopeptide (TPR) repeat protein